MSYRNRPQPVRVRPGAPTLRPHALALALAAAGLAQATWAQNVPVTTLPTGGQVVRGTATISTGGTTTNPSMTINQTSNRAVLNWGTFSVGRDARVDHTTPGRDAITLHRVVGLGNGPSPSFIDGTMTSNGRVFLVNTAGVVFGSTAQVNVGALLASSRDLDPSLSANNFEGFVNGQTITLNQGQNFVRFDPLTGALIGGDLVTVAGGAQLTAAPDGSIVLVSNAQTASGGQLRAPGGNVSLIAAGSTTLNIGDSGFVRLVGQPLPGTPGSRAIATVAGTTETPAVVAAPNGTVQIIALMDGETLATASVSLATIEARGENGGQGRVEIIVPNDGGFIGADQIARVQSATIDVSAADAQSRAGSVLVSGRVVDVQSIQGAPASVIRADGPNGGGLIQLGEVRGRSDLAPARSIVVGSGTTLSADATASGNGGRIQVLSTLFEPRPGSLPVARLDFGVTEVYGTLTARGGPGGGNGGTIETSGPSITTSLVSRQGALLGRATVDASARSATGNAGSWLIDPYDIVIGQSSPTANVNGQFEPTAVGALINSTDINNAMNAGVNVTVSTGTGGNQAGNITVQSGTSIGRTAGSAPVSLTLSAANDVIIEPFVAIGSTAGAMPITLRGDSDFNGQGRVIMEGFPGGPVNASNTRGLRTNALNPPSITLDSAGGDITISGRASSSAAPTAVSILNASIAAGAGALSIQGSSTSFGSGVVIDDTSLQGAGVRVDGNGSTSGVTLANSDVTSGARGTDIRGTASGDAFGIGVALDGVVDLSIGTGNLTIGGIQGNGGPGSAGLSLGAVNVRTADGAGGTVTIFGQASGISGIGGSAIVRRGELTGLRIGGASANAASGANVVIGGSADAGAVFGSGMSDGVLIRTTGSVNIRPLEDIEGQIVGAVGTPIRINGSGSGGSSAPLGFVVPGEWLSGVNGNLGIAASGIVVGASDHRGAIAVSPGALEGTQAPPIGLQTRSNLSFEGSAGNSNLNLTIAAAGNVTQGGGLAATQLAILGSNTANVTLTSTANRIGRLSFDGPSLLSLSTAGALSVDTGTALGFDPNTGFTSTNILGSRGGIQLLLRSLDSDVVMNRSISMLAGAGSQVDLVAAERFRNNNGSTIDFVGGGLGGPDLWRVWSRTWEGTNRAPLDAPSLYGCQFGDTATCRTSGVAIPQATNLFLYGDQPSLSVTANAQSVRAGTALGPLTYTVTGLVNGDAQDEALSGALASPATASSPPGSYAITQGTLASALGYRINYTGASVTITAAATGGGGLAIDLDPKAFQFTRGTRFFEDQRTDVYGSNSPSRPQICIGSSAIRGVVAEGNDVEPLVIEWVRVRGQPKLSGCLTVRNEESCAAF